MTFRAKPVVKRSSKSSWESRDRRNLYLNLGFGLAVVAAIVILIAAFAVQYYDQNLAPVGSVNGQSITKSDLAKRAEIELWRLEEASRRISTQVVAGQLTQAQADAQKDIIAQQQNQISSIALERIIDDRIQAQLAERDGIAVTDADIDARLTEEATTPEARHGWVIEVEPAVDAGAVDPTAAQVAEARAKADQALRDLQGGTAWEDVARTVSTDASTAPQAGDLGWLTEKATLADESFITALFGVEVDVPTAVIEGSDGIFRIGRVTQVAPENVDGAYQDKIVNDEVDLVAYREVVRGDVVRQKLEDAAVADAIKPGPQRQVSEIFIAESDPTVPETAVKVRHILYSPDDDPEAASSGTIADDDPAWTTAKADADAAYARLQADPSLFDSIARTESDETYARGSTGSGGKLPGYIAEDSGYVQGFLDAVLVPGLTDGQIVGPFQTEFGWHIAQIMYHPKDLDLLNKLKTQADAGADFAALARDYSESDSAGEGGNLGWIARGQLGEEQTKAIFEATLGKTSNVALVTGEGLYLYQVRSEETRTPEGRQLEELRTSAFSDWYDTEKATFEIERDPSFSDFIE